MHATRWTIRQATGTCDLLIRDAIQKKAICIVPFKYENHTKIAAQIVREHNAHAALVEAVNKLINLSSHPYFVTPSDLPAWEETIQQTKAALRLAKGD